jgi:hypothetical protein
MSKENCSEKIEQFIDKLKTLGYEVRFISKKPQFYEIDGELVNVRCTTMIKDIHGDEKFWYSVNYNALREARWFIYLMTKSHYFVMFPRDFLHQIYERMYPNHKSLNDGVFYIDWGALKILLQGGSEDISAYYQNLIENEEYPNFKG